MRYWSMHSNVVLSGILTRIHRDSAQSVILMKHAKTPGNDEEIKPSASLAFRSGVNSVEESIHFMYREHSRVSVKLGCANKLHAAA